MCFAPYISLATFTIEFLLALYFILKNPRDKLNQMIALISFFLGFYQLNEFLICTVQHSVFTKLAMVTTAVLPALAVSYALILARKRLSYKWNALIYSPVAFFILMFVLAGYFKDTGICHNIFIEYPTMGLLGDFYALYYFSYIFGAAVLFYLFSGKAKDQKEKNLMSLGMMSMFIFTVPAFIFVIFLPMFYIQFPSVLCEFALLLAIEFIIMIWYKERHGIRF